MAHQSNKVTAYVTSYAPDIKDPVDTLPSDQQPPGVDKEDEWEPQSLEEALLGE